MAQPDICCDRAATTGNAKARACTDAALDKAVRINRDFDKAAACTQGHGHAWVGRPWKMTLNPWEHAKVKLWPTGNVYSA